MVKGISKQVIVVHAPDPKLFEQAIFILKEDALGQEGITDEALLKEAKKLIQHQPAQRKVPLYHYGAIWACTGAGITGFLWLICSLL